MDIAGVRLLIICDTHGKASVNQCMCNTSSKTEHCYKCHLEQHHLNKDEGQIKSI